MMPILCPLRCINCTDMFFGCLFLLWLRVTSLQLIKFSFEVRSIETNGGCLDDQLSGFENKRF